MLLNWLKTLIIGIGCLFLFHSSPAQDNMGIGTTSPNPKSILELSSTDQGFLMPRMDSSQRVNISPSQGTADAGLIVYDQTDSVFYYWNASQWVPLNNQGGSGPDGDWTISGNDMYNNVSGNTGIGTASPSAKLHTNGSLRFAGLSLNSDNDVLVIDGNGDVSYRTLSSGVWDGDDNDYVDGINVTGSINKTITLTRTGSLGSLNASLSIEDADADSTNELNTDLQLNGATLELSDAGGTLTQDLSGIGTDDQDIDGSVLSANNVLTIGIENGANETVDLSTLNQPNTDNQDLGSNTVSGTVKDITITNGSNTSIDVADNDNDPTNEYNTSVNLNGTDLEIKDGGGTLTEDLSPLQSGSKDADADSTNELQDLSSSKSSNNVTVDITDGNPTSFNVDDADADPTNEYNTGISLSGNTLNITDNGSTLSQDLSSINTDNQDIQNLGFSTTNNELTVGITNGASQTVDLSALDQPNTDNQNVFQDIQNAAGTTQFSAGNPSDNLQFRGQNGASVSFDAANNRIIIDAGGSGDDWGSQTVNSDGTLSGDGAGTQLSVDWSAANDLDNSGNVNLATLSGGDGISGSNYNGSSSTTWSVDWSDANDLDASGNVDQLWNEQSNDDISYGGGSEGDVRIGTNSFTNYQLQVDGEFVITEKSSHTLPNSSSAVWMLKRPTGAEIKTIDDNDNLDTLRLKASNVSIGDPYPSEARLSVEDETSTAGYFAGQDVENNSGNWTSAVQIEDPEGDKLYMDGDEIDAGIGGDASDDALYLQNNNSNDVVMVDGGGKVGIGANPPSYQLDVTGDINVTGGIRASGNNGTSGQVLKTDGTNVYWGSDNTGSGGDNLGNHTATQTLDMNGNNITDNSGSNPININQSIEVTESNDLAIKAIGQNSEEAYLAAQGDVVPIPSSNFGDEIGVAGVSTGSTSNDNYGVMGYSNGVAGKFEHDGTGNDVELANDNGAIDMKSGGLNDNTGSTGSSGDVLTSSGSGVEWQQRGVQYEKVYQDASGTIWQHPNTNVSVDWDGNGQITVNNNTGSIIMISMKKIEEGGSTAVNIQGKTNWENDGNSLSMSAVDDHSYKVFVTDFQSSSPGFKMDVHGRDGNWVGGIVKYWN